MKKMRMMLAVVGATPISSLRHRKTAIQIRETEACFVFRLQVIGVPRPARWLRAGRGRPRTNEDRVCDPHLRFSFGKAIIRNDFA